MANRFRNKLLGIRLTEKEWAFIKAKIEKSGLSQREYLLQALSKKPIIVKPYGHEIASEIKAIGRNINQIAKKVNSREIADYTTQLEAISEQLGKVMEQWQ
ncbi:MAG: MobC family plasmid mobilization relaxosome protein [Clostridiales bacterium]|nr:MobC family plasmid mobilization relaxosome protein [Clostridiales bacterium]